MVSGSSFSSEIAGAEVLEPIRVRQDIVEAATHVFSKYGYHGASMADIAQAVGIRKASLYHHLRKKEDLLLAIHEGLVNDLIERTELALANRETPGDRLAAVLHAAMEFIGSNKEGVTVFLSEAGVVATGERWDAIVAKRDFYESRVAAIVRDGMDRGEFIELPHKVVARGVLAMANWCYTWFEPTRSMTADEVADIFVTMALHGLMRRDGDAPRDHTNGNTRPKK